jgi:predicted AAA+ superfamily ATPase
MPLAYRTRLADIRLAQLLREFPAILINGPRAVGKTTTGRQHAADVVRLDRPAESAVFRADPDAALRRRKEPLLLDEWQEAPEVLAAVKRTVDEDPRPGRFNLHDPRPLDPGLHCVSGDERQRTPAER